MPLLKTRAAGDNSAPANLNGKPKLKKKVVKKIKTVKKPASVNKDETVAKAEKKILPKKENTTVQDQRKKELKSLLKNESGSLNKGRLEALRKISQQEVLKLVEGKKIKTLEKIPFPLATNSLMGNFNKVSIGDEISRTIDAALALISKDSKNKYSKSHKEYEEKRLKELKISSPAMKLTKMKEQIFKEWLAIQQKTTN